MIVRYAVAAAVACAAMAVYSATLVQKGVTIERVRVEAKGRKVDARAKVARKKAEQKPDVALERWCRDCR